MRIMTISLTHAKECLRDQTPKEYVSQLAVVSNELRRARLSGKAGKGTPGDPLAALRAVLEPDNG